MTSIHIRRLANAVDRMTARVVNEARRLSGGGLIDPDILPTLRLPWFEVRNADGTDTARGEDTADAATVFIFDEIGGSLGLQAADLVQDIEAITAPQIKVRINSPGGSVFDALAIYNALNHHPARITTIVDAIAASAASVIAMAGDEVVMMPGSQMMIHDASAMLDGNQHEHEQLGTFLGRQSDNIADIYRMRAGGTAEDWRQRMLDETWAFAQEAVDLGLADRVQTPPERLHTAEDLDPEDTERMTRSFDLGRYRYAGRRHAPAPGNARQRRATTTPRDPEVVNTRAQAAAARRRHFESATPVTMPDGTTQRTQTRSGVLGLGDRRSVPFGTELRGAVESRNGRDLYHVHGYATVFDKPYRMWDSFGEYDEVVTRGAADRTLMSDPDVAFLVNHGGVTMARTTNGTLSLSADATGLVQDAWLNPNRVDVQTIMSAIDDGLVTEMSFAFMIPNGGGRWSDDFETFEITQFDIDRGDVSAVNYGASPWTTIAARAQELMSHVDMLPAGVKRELVKRLGSQTDRQERRSAATDAPDITPGLDLSPLSAPLKPSRERVPAKQGRTITLIEAMLSD